MNDKLLEKALNKTMKMMETTCAVVIYFIISTIMVKECSADFDAWKKLNRGGAVIKIAANNKALYLIDNQNRLNVIDSESPVKNMDSGIKYVDVDDQYGLVLAQTTEAMKARAGISSSNAVGTGWNTFPGSAIGMVTGRHGLIFHWNLVGRTYQATGITSSNREGTGWMEVAIGSQMKKISCSGTACFSIDISNALYSSGYIPSGYSPTLLNPQLVLAKISTNVKDVSAFSGSTLWKIDSNGTAWQAVNFLGNQFIKLNWERRSYQPLKFIGIAATNKIQYAITDDNNAHVFTGCPIFDFEDNDLSKWTMTGTAFAKQPVVSQETYYGRLSAKEGNRIIDTYSSRTSYDVAEDAAEATQQDTPVGTLESPLFQIRTNILHFIIGGGSAPTNHVDLYINGVQRFRASGASADKANANKNTRAGRYWWDVSSYINSCAYIKIHDDSSVIHGHTLFDDLCASPPCFKGIKVWLENIDHDGNATLGQKLTFKLHLNGFYTSKTRPLSINVSFPTAKEAPFMYVKSLSRLSSKCSTSVTTTKSTKTLPAKSPYCYSFSRKFTNYLLSDSVVEITTRAYDHSDLQKGVQKSIQAAIKVNFADEYIQTIKPEIKIIRHGNETANLVLTEGMVGGNKFYVGNNITYNVQLNQNTTSQQRAFNLIIRLFLPPYLALVTVSGLESSSGDRLVSSTTSQVTVRINELLLEGKRNITFIMRIRNDYAWSRLYSSKMQGIFLVDAISYCNTQSCKNATDNDSTMVSLLKMKEYNFTVSLLQKKKAAKKYKKIVVNGGSLVIVCGTDSIYGAGSNSRCYYGNSSTDCWYRLNHKLIDILYYDQAEGKIFGLFVAGQKVELHGEMFKEYKILTTDEWDAVLARAGSLVAGLAVENPDRFVNKHSNGKLPHEWECCSTNN